METGAAALERMCDGAAKVSAHYMVEEDGRIFQMVDEDKRAWHAGVSEWRGETNINSASIGIEIVNGGHDCPQKDGTLPPYPVVQINALTPLCKAIMSRHTIGAEGVVGHSDIAPERKQDPGEHFPWAGLSAAGIGRFPLEIEPDRRVLFSAGSRDRGVAIVQRGLAEIGYSARVTGVMDEDTRLVVAAFQRRYRPAQIDGLVDMETMAIVRWIVEGNNALG